MADIDRSERALTNKNEVYFLVSFYIDEPFIVEYLGYFSC